ncbi:MAG TPA: hypothetical protein VFK44_09810 [Bacillales bacterium]|nr:hypothetical protein [Bacillales bacterium]
MLWKTVVLWMLPLAAFLGTLIGFFAGGAQFHLWQRELLVFLAVWIIAGSIVDFATERARMNQSREYR